MPCFPPLQIPPGVAHTVLFFHGLSGLENACDAGQVRAPPLSLFTSTQAPPAPAAAGGWQRSARPPGRPAQGPSCCKRAVFPAPPAFPPRRSGPASLCSSMAPPSSPICPRAACRRADALCRGKAHAPAAPLRPCKPGRQPAPCQQTTLPRPACVDPVSYPCSFQRTAPPSCWLRRCSIRWIPWSCGGTGAWWSSMALRAASTCRWAVPQRHLCDRRCVGKVLGGQRRRLEQAAGLRAARRACRQRRRRIPAQACTAPSPPQFSPHAARPFNSFVPQEPDTSASSVQALICMLSADEAFFPLGFAYGHLRDAAVSPRKMPAALPAGACRQGSSQ